MASAISSTPHASARIAQWSLDDYMAARPYLLAGMPIEDVVAFLKQTPPHELLPCDVAWLEASCTAVGLPAHAWRSPLR